MQITLLKLGGSLITDKDKPFTLKEDNIHRVLSEIAQVYKQRPDLSLILGNGAGSFGHTSAHKYKTHQGFSDEKGKLGACITHKDAANLNSILIEKCLELNLPVYSLQPSAILFAKNNNLAKDCWSTLDVLLSQHMIPFVYGDVILDTAKGSTIYSTDTLFRIIAEHLIKQKHTVRIVHAGNYPGVLDKDGKLIPKITPKNFENISSSIRPSESVDVTGGMKHKVDELLELAKTGIDSRIVNGKIKGNIKKAILKDMSGTLLTALIST